MRRRKTDYWLEIAIQNWAQIMASDPVVHEEMIDMCQIQLWAALNGNDFITQWVFDLYSAPPWVHRERIHEPDLVCPPGALEGLEPYRWYTPVVRRISRKLKELFV